MGLFQKKVETHKRMIVAAAADLLKEDERVYRNQVALFAREHHPAAVRGPGLLKARLLACAFPATAFQLRWGEKKPGDCFEMLQALSGLAVWPLTEAGAVPAVTHDEAVRIGRPFLSRQLPLIQDELADGPSSLGSGELSADQLEAAAAPEMHGALTELLGISDPGRSERLRQRLAQGPQTERLTTGFAGLLESCREAFIDSVGAVAYDATARARFDRMFRSGLMGKLRLLAELVGAIS